MTSTLVDLIFQENPGKKRQEFLKKIEEEIKNHKVWALIFV